VQNCKGTEVLDVTNKLNGQGSTLELLGRKVFAQSHIAGPGTTAPDGNGIGDGGADKILAMGMNLGQRYGVTRCTARNTGCMWTLDKIKIIAVQDLLVQREGGIFTARLIPGLKIADHLETQRGGQNGRGLNESNHLLSFVIDYTW
jgi:hypothetical protein